MKNLPFHGLLRWKMIITNSLYLTYTFLLKRLGERTFLLGSERVSNTNLYSTDSSTEMLLPVCRYRCSYIRLLIFVATGTMVMIMKNSLHDSDLERRATIDYQDSYADSNPTEVFATVRDPDSSNYVALNPTVSDVYTTAFKPTTGNYPKAERKRSSLLIFGADRSGTTFISRMFGEDSQMFMVYEPLWVTKKWRTEHKSQDWKGSELGVVDAILSCDFAKTTWGRMFLAHTTKNWAAAKFPNPFTSDRFCNYTRENGMKCFNLTAMPEVAKKLCLTKYKHSVTKIAQVRVEEKLISSLIPQVFIDNPDTDVRVLQILRDPRGFFNSRIKMKWIPDWQGGREFKYQVKYACDKIAENIKYGRLISSLMPGRYMEARYKDISLQPIETAKSIYEFANFEMPTSLIDWIIENTNPSKEALTQGLKRVFGSIRNSSANVDKWRSESPIERIEVIERECREVFELLPDLDLLTLPQVDENWSPNLVPRAFLVWVSSPTNPKRTRGRGCWSPFPRAVAPMDAG